MQAATLHATSISEKDDIRQAGIEVPSTVISHGCEFPPDEGLRTPTTPKLAVSVSRIHPVKGLDDLINAWATVKPAEWQLVIAGPGESRYAANIRARIRALGLSSSVTVVGNIDDTEKWKLLSRAALFVSASHSENFGMSIAEALMAGTPVITTHATPWEAVTEIECGWWVPTGASSLAPVLHEATSLGGSSLAEMGRRGTEFIRSEYSWQVIAERMISLYKDLLNQPIGVATHVS